MTVTKLVQRAESEHGGDARRLFIADGCYRRAEGVITAGLANVHGDLFSAFGKFHPSLSLPMAR